MMGEGGADPGSTPPAPVAVRELDNYQGQPSFHVTTPGAVYVYHKLGGGFASLFDADGNDWISFRPTGGSAGHYRGIPNLVYPEGIFHPGNRNCTSRLLATRPDSAVIESESLDGRWACRWDILPTHARMTLTRASGPYWFLYEGTPGGRIDYGRDEVLRSSGRRSPAGEGWREVLPHPAWVCFRDGGTGRLIWLVQHEADEQIDQYWPMEHNMTVFGFGRDDRGGLKKLMTRVPARFSFGLSDEFGPDHARRLIEAIG